MSGSSSDSYIKRNITLNTIFNINSTLQNPGWFLPRPLKNVVGVKVKDIIIPNSFYTIDSRNNILSINENNGGTIANIKITLATGNYTIDTIVNTLGSLLTTASSAGITYTASYSSFTDVLTISGTGGNPGFNVATVDNTVNYELGFTNAQANTVSSSLTSISGKNSFDLSGIKALNLCTPIFGNIGENVGSNYSILATVPITSPFSGISTLVDYSADYLSSNSNSIDNISFLTFDERMRPINPQNDYQITIGVNIRN